MKKVYIKPDFKVVKLQSRTRLMVGSIKKVSRVQTSLPDDDDLEFEGGADGDIVAR